ncbi:MAG: glycosyltransferase family 2 protein [Patescibacteria group bacterium]
MKSVSIIIPSYNGKKLLEKHLPAVTACMRKGDELLIIDDASSDDTVQWLKNKKNIKVISNKKNLRFAATVNKAVKLAKHDLVFLINNDVAPHKDCLKYLLTHFDDKKTFAVGCQEIEEAGILGGKNKLEFKRGIFVHSRAKEFSSGETAWASGGSAIFDRKKWLKLKGFDLDYYPAYWEDIDLSFRARRKNWKIFFESKAKVDHKHETTNKMAFGIRKMRIMSVKNSLVFLWKNASFLQKLMHLLWLPYHLTVTNMKMQGIFLAGFISFFHKADLESGKF